jgi:mono/diheme cytochrome c family protein
MTRLARLALKVVAGTILLLSLVAAAGWTYVMAAYPRLAPARALKVAGTPEQVARGRYLSEHVVGCTDCHGERDWTRYSAPQMASRAGHGGMTFRLPVATLHAPNITPAAIGAWTDGELLRAITDGVSRDGRPLFPMMPYENFRVLGQDDAEALIAFVRTLAPAVTTIPASTIAFPMNLIMRTLPAPVTLPAHAPPRSDRVAYGRYLATIASCATCHTRMERGRPIEGMAYAGGLEFKTRHGRVQYSANITPDIDTGIGAWTEEAFIGRFKAVGDAPESELALNGRPNTEMPWRDYGGMTAEDLGAIFSYLRTVPAVRHRVQR